MITLNRPSWAGETAALAMVATDLHEQRVAAYPGLVSTGKLAADAAAAGLRIAAAIAIDWRRRANLAPLPCETMRAARVERIATLEQALARPRHQCAKTRAAVSRDTHARAAVYADLPDIDRAQFLFSLVEAGLAVDAGVKPWLFACEYLELIETLLWWERQTTGFDELTTLTAALRASVAIKSALAA